MGSMDRRVGSEMVTRFFFCMNNFIGTMRLKFGQKLRTSKEQFRLGFGIINAKFNFS